MNKEIMKKAWLSAKANAVKRKFKQSGEIIINLKDIDLKKPEQQLDVFVNLPHSTGNPVKICAFVGPELLAQAKTSCDTVVAYDDFKRFGDKKMVKKLAREHKHFIAQATIMPDVARFFGRVLGPKNKMPNPKAGCVVPPNAALKPLVEKLRNTVRVVAKTQLSAKALIGKEDSDDDKVADNLLAVYQQIVSKLPGEKSNVKNVLIKLTMSKPMKVQE
ncbi:50S ribosomal protein L1 [Candidatus Woesearchaeota archaeon]|nr:50S ribosomal protein L1 [Candidatus Woesearchaeota archaeon]